MTNRSRNPDDKLRFVIFPKALSLRFLRLCGECVWLRLCRARFVCGFVGAAWLCATLLDRGAAGRLIHARLPLFLSLERLDQSVDDVVRNHKHRFDRTGQNACALDLQCLLLVLRPDDFAKVSVQSMGETFTWT